MLFDNIYDGRPIYSSFFHSIARALNGGSVLSGLSLSISDLSLTISSGQISYNGVTYDVAETTISVNSGDSDKAILIVWNYNGGNPSLTSIESTATFIYGGREFVKAPVPSDDSVVLYLLIYRAGATTIDSSDVYDLRLATRSFTGESSSDCTNISSLEVVVL